MDLLLGFAQVDDDEDEEAYEGQGTDDLSALLDQFSSAAAAEVEVDTGASGSGSTDSVEPPEPEPAPADSSSAAPDLDFPIFAPIEIDLVSPEPAPTPPRRSDRAASRGHVGDRTDRSFA